MEGKEVRFCSEIVVFFSFGATLPRDPAVVTTQTYALKMRLRNILATKNKKKNIEGDGRKEAGKNKQRRKESGHQRKYRRTLEGFAGLPPRR